MKLQMQAESIPKNKEAALSGTASFYKQLFFFYQKI
jgi:hypothetical protein